MAYSKIDIEIILKQLYWVKWNLLHNNNRTCLWKSLGSNNNNWEKVLISLERTIML